MKPESALILDAMNVTLTSNTDGTLRMTSGKRVYPRVRVVLMTPLTQPEGYAMVQAAEGKEIGLLKDLGKLGHSSKAALETAKLFHYLTSPILKIHDLAYQFGAVYWDVTTSRGRREFVIQGTTEHVRWLSDERLLITDVDGNRFEIPDRTKLDKKSQGLLDLIL